MSNTHPQTATYLSLDARRQRRIQLLTRLAKRALRDNQLVFWLPLTSKLEEATKIISAKNFLARPRFIP